MKRSRICAISIIIILVTSMSYAFVATNYVAPGGSDANGGTGWGDAWVTISNAVVQSSTGDLILVSNGTYAISAQITIDKDLTVRGFSGDPADTIVDGAGNNITCFYLTNGFPNAVVESMTISNAYRGVFLDHGGTVRNCILTHHRVGFDSETGAYCYYGGLVENCISRYNKSKYTGAGIHLDNGGTARNCLVTHNEAYYPGGGIKTKLGVIDSCTIVSNYSSQSAGGVYVSVNGYITNCIVRNNDAPTDPDFGGNNEHFFNCCLPRTPTGGANTVTNDPMLVSVEGGNFHLLPGSPCIGGGTNETWMSAATDLDGNNRINGSSVDIGCYEYTPGALDCNFWATPLSGISPLDVVFTGYVAGTNETGVHYFWDFDNDGSYDVDGIGMSTVTNTYSQAGTYSVKLMVTNAVGETDSFTRVDFLSFAPAVLYVAQGTNNPTFPYDSWAIAASNIQDAVDAAVANTTVLVDDGHYLLTNTVSIGVGTTVQSVNGKQATILDGNGNVECVYMSDADAVLDGFTITNGYISGDTAAGGIHILAGTARNCDIVGNGKSGGGNATGGFLIEGSAGTLENCRVMRNIGRRYGAGGGKCSGGVVSNCIIIGNVAREQSTGGIDASGGATIRNCLIAGNTVSVSPGTGGIQVDDATIESCTITDNRGRSRAGGLRCVNRTTSMKNTIIHFNYDLSDDSLSNWVKESGTLNSENACTTPTLGTDCITSDPLFLQSGSGYGLSYTNGDFNLQAGSPCIDTGTNQTWMVGALDLNEQGRISKGIVDIGAYEWYPPQGTCIIVR